MTYVPVNDYPANGTEPILTDDYPAVTTPQLEARKARLEHIRDGGSLFGLGIVGRAELAMVTAEITRRAEPCATT